jgi:putative ABC transport system permease protein
MDTLIKDIRYAVRACINNRRFTIVIVLTLAVGIGTTAALFTVVNAVILRPLTYKDSDQLLRVFESNPRKDSEFFSVSPPNYLDWKQHNQVFEDEAAMWRSEDLNMVATGEPEQVSATRVTANMFDVLGVAPAIGRGFLPEDEQPANEPVAMLSHRIWEHRFGEDKNILGQTLKLNGVNYTVIGVMPREFELPFNDGQLYLPLRFTEPDLNRGRRTLRVIGRMKPGVTLPQVQADLGSIARNLEQQYPNSNAGWGIALKELKSIVVPDEFKGSLMLLLGAVGFVLLIACVNVANLLSVRATSRQKEMAIRTALGATRGKLIRQLLIESALMSVSGGILGLLVAYWGVDILLKVNPEEIPRLNEISVDWQVLGFTFLISMLCVAIFGTIPAVQASKADVTTALKEASRGSTGGPGRRRMRDAMVVTEVALAVIVVIGAGLLVKSFRQLQQVDPGFDPSHVLTVGINLPESKYPKREAAESFFMQLAERISALPGVVSVGTANSVPMSGRNSMNVFFIEGRPLSPDQSEAAAYRIVSPSYFSTMKMPLLKGRLFEANETRDTARVMVIDESMQRRYWPNEDPIGRYVRFGGPKEPPSMIIGVVKDVKTGGLDSEALPTMYLSSLQMRPQHSTTFVIRTNGDPLNMAAATRSQIQGLDSEQAVASMEAMEDIVSRSLAGWRFNMVIFATFAVIAILLASVGIYSVIAYSVNQRTHEIGVRMALGAMRHSLMAMVLRQGMVLAIVGVCIGLGASFALTRIMSHMLFDVSPTDVAIFVTGAMLSLVVAPAACLIPARRATKVNPLRALREE